MPGSRLKIAVVAWDLAHNGASSAFVLADMLGREHDVELVGPMFLGGDLWEPIRHADIPIRSFPGRPLPQFVDDAEAAANDITADVIVACKPRFPTLLLSMLIKDGCGAPIVLHIDDLELGLVGADGAMPLAELERHRGEPDVLNPAGRLWTAASEALIPGADAITVSGPALQERYGGVTLGQPRDETQFDPARIDRQRVRAEFGYGPEDRVVLFLGSPRPHKGIRELATAASEIDDRHVKLCVIGSFTDPELRAEIAAGDPERVQLVDYRPIAEAPRLTMIGDLVCLPQDVRYPFVPYQTPMKLTEALAMGLPVLASETPSLSPFVDLGVIAPIGEGPLSQRIAEILADPGDRAARGRALFLDELSYAAVLRTMSGVIAGLPAAPVAIPPSWEHACDLACALVPASRE